MWSPHVLVTRLGEVQMVLVPWLYELNATKCLDRPAWTLRRSCRQSVSRVGEPCVRPVRVVKHLVSGSPF